MQGSGQTAAAAARPSFQLGLGSGGGGRRQEAPAGRCGAPAPQGCSGPAAASSRASGGMCRSAGPALRASRRSPTRCCTLPRANFAGIFPDSSPFPEPARFQGAGPGGPTAGYPAVTSAPGACLLRWGKGQPGLGEGRNPRGFFSPGGRGTDTRRALKSRPAAEAALSQGTIWPSCICDAKCSSLKSSVSSFLS